jgi:hypothetical protein
VLYLILISIGFLYMSKRSLKDAGSSDDDSSSGDDEERTSSIALKTLPRAARDNALSKLSILGESDDDDDDFLEQKPKPVKKQKVATSSLLSTSMANSAVSVSDSAAAPTDKIVKKKSKALAGANTGVSTVSEVKAPEIVKRIISRVGDAEWMEADIGEERVAAVSKAIDKIFEMSLNAENFRLFGNDMIQCFYDVGTGKVIYRCYYHDVTVRYTVYVCRQWSPDFMTTHSDWRSYSQEDAQVHGAAGEPLEVHGHAGGLGLEWSGLAARHHRLRHRYVLHGEVRSK